MALCKAEESQKMNDEERKAKSNEKMALHLLAALTKKEGGRLAITDSELDAVDVADTLLFYFDKKTRDIILTITTMEPDTTIDN